MNRSALAPARPSRRREPQARPPVPSIPRLESGDRLTRAEFERRYDAMPEGTKAELIGGIVYVASPTSKRHGFSHAKTTTWLGTYHAATPGTEVAAEATDRLSDDDEPQPDVFLLILPEAGGAMRVDPDDILSGPPELVVEVALSSAAYDLHQKHDAYLRHGCREYLVVVLEPAEVRWFRLAKGAYVPLAPGKDGIHRSRVFPGLWLEGNALLAGDAARVLAILKKGLATKEHAAFARKLARRLARR